MCDAHTNKTTLKCIMYVLFRKLHSNLQVTKHRCGVVWCGVVWCVVWCGVMWCGVMWCGVVWCG